MSLRPELELRSVDVVLAIALTVTGQLEIWAPDQVPAVSETAASRPFLAVTTLVMTMAILGRRTWPLTVAVLVLGANVVQEVFSEPNEGLSSLAACLVACYSVGAHTVGGRAIAGGVVVVMGAALIGEDVSDHLFIAIVLGAAWLMGFVVGQRSEQVVMLSEDNRDLQERLAAAAAALSAAEHRRHLSSDSSDDETLAGLTRREIDVARAIATGMSNAEIAAHLVISEWTVKTHVASILRKLQLRDRSQVVVAAYESGLVVPRR